MPLAPATTWTLLPAVAVALFAISGIATTLLSFFDPCHEWGMQDDGDGMTIGPDDRCPSRSGTSQTRAGAVFNLVAVNGVMLLAAGALTVGASRPDPTWTAAGGAALFVLVPPFGLGLLWIPTLLAAVAVAVSSLHASRLAVLDPRWTRGAYGVTALAIGLVVVFLLYEGAHGLAGVAAGFGLVGALVVVGVAHRAGSADQGAAAG